MSPDATPTYFAIFSLPPHLTLDTRALEKSFYALSRRLHPDRFAHLPDSAQTDALTQSSRLNDAYRTLKDPIARTQYLLKLEGVELEEQSSAATAAARATGTATNFSPPKPTSTPSSPPPTPTSPPSTPSGTRPPMQQIQPPATEPPRPPS